MPSLEHVKLSEYSCTVRSMETVDTACDILLYLVKSKVRCAKLLNSSTGTHNKLPVINDSFYQLTEQYKISKVWWPSAHHLYSYQTTSKGLCQGQ
jgi:hypothetical protein